MKTIEILMNDTTGKLSELGQPIRADGWYGSRDGLHTIQITVANFKGRIGLQASLAVNPDVCDWFNINLGGNKPFIEYECAENSSKSYNFVGNFMWIRAIMDRENLGYDPDLYELSQLGTVNRILLSR